MARPMLADADFVKKVREGNADRINICIACNQACLDRIFSDRSATCLVNPRACRETEFDEGPAKEPRESRWSERAQAGSPPLRRRADAATR